MTFQGQCINQGQTQNGFSCFFCYGTNVTKIKKVIQTGQVCTEAEPPPPPAS